MNKKSKKCDAPIIHEQEEELNRLDRKRHVELFPEEYDHMFDSMSEARERQRGGNLAAQEHLKSTILRRTIIAVEPISLRVQAVSCDVPAVDAQKVREPGEVPIPKGITFTEEGLETGSTIRGAEVTQPRSTMRTVADILNTEAFLDVSDDRNDPEVVAVRILGALFELNPGGLNEPLFHEHLQSALPKLQEAEYHRLFRVAMKEWCEAYGF